MQSKQGFNTLSGMNNARTHTSEHTMCTINMVCILGGQSTNPIVNHLLQGSVEIPEGKCYREPLL